MENDISSRALRSFLAVVLLAAAASSAHATRLRLDRAALDFDPNQPIWHVSTHLCNTDQVPTGTINYHVYVYQDDPSSPGRRWHIYDLGGVKFGKTLQPGECWDYADTKVRVNYKNTPSAQYHLELIVGEWDGSKFVTRIIEPFLLDNGLHQDFIKN